MVNLRNSSRKRTNCRTRRQAKKESITKKKIQVEEVDSPKPNDESNRLDSNPRIIIDMECTQKIIITQAVEHARICDDELTSSNESWKLIKLHCSSFSYYETIMKDSDIHELPINEALVIGSYCAGIGFTTWKTIANCLEISFFSKEKYQKAEVKVGLYLQKLVDEDMAKNLEAVKDYCTENEQTFEVDGKKYPFTSVIVDGGWAKRSYGHSFNSNAGVAVIISDQLQKVLYMGYRIKICKI